jgi:hypothetical protein
VPWPFMTVSVALRLLRCSTVVLPLALQPGTPSSVTVIGPAVVDVQLTNTTSVGCLHACQHSRCAGTRVSTADVQARLSARMQATPPSMQAAQQQTAAPYDVNGTGRSCRVVRARGACQRGGCRQRAAILLSDGSDRAQVAADDLHSTQCKAGREPGRHTGSCEGALPYCGTLQFPAGCAAPTRHVCQLLPRCRAAGTACTQAVSSQLVIFLVVGVCVLALAPLCDCLVVALAHDWRPACTPPTACCCRLACCCMQEAAL